MLTIAGVTGHVGSAVARELLAAGEKITVLVRDGAKGDAWSHRGADVTVVELGDRAGLADAVRGTDGFFTLLPFDFTAQELDAAHLDLAASIAGAVQDAGVPHVVMLSSWGAELPEGTGPIRWLHDLETRLRETGTTLSAVRSCHFQENVRDVLGAAQAAGIYPVLGESADVPIPLAATRDVGVVVAELYAADHDGLLKPKGDRHVHVHAPIDQTLRDLVEVARAAQDPVA